MSSSVTSDPKADQIKDCICWLVPIFDRYSVPYQIVGGLAAKLYGARRPLVDIDFYADMHAPGFATLLSDIRSHLKWGPEHFRDQSWDITFLKIDRGGQRVEIGDSNDAYFFDHGSGQWVQQLIDYDASETCKLFGLAIRVMPRPALIAYKKMLARDVDLADLADLEPSEAL